MEKQPYIDPIMEVIRLENESVITTSPEGTGTGEP